MASENKDGGKNSKGSVNERLQVFVESFVKHFDRRLKNFRDEIAAKPISSKVVADIIGLKHGTSGLKEKEGENAGEKLEIVPSEGHQNESALKINEVFTLSGIQYQKAIVEAAVDIFQSFESQFLKVSVAGGWQLAMNILAKDATEKLMNHINDQVETEEEISRNFITKCFIQGKSKEIMGTLNIIVPFKSKDKVKYQEKQCDTASLFEKSGIITKETGSPAKYYGKQKNTHTKKYGYRLLFEWETLNPDYKEEDPVEEYEYILVEQMIESSVQDILREIERKNAKETAEKGDVNERLQVFVESFVEHFEAKLTSYRNEIEERITKTSRTFGEVTALTTTGICSFVPGGSVVGKVGEIGVKYLGESSHNAKASKIIEVFHLPATQYRKVLVEAAVDIFQCFESQFAKVTAEGGWRVAMNKLARDAMERVMNYVNEQQGNRQKIHEEMSRNFITKCFLLGKSKAIVEALSIVIPITCKRKVKYQEKQCNTTSLYEIVGIVSRKEDGSPDKYYKMKKKTNTKEFGYRLLFAWEPLTQDSKKEDPIVLYDYVLKYVESERKVQELLNKINHEDQKLKPGRIESKLDQTHDIIVEVQERQIRVENKLDGIGAGKHRDKNQPVWFDARNPVSSFTGRRKELDKLHEIVQRNGDGTVVSQITSVSGLGGIGKTELVRQYIYEHREEYDNNIIWINAETEKSLVGSFHNLAKEVLGIKIKDEDGSYRDIIWIAKDIYGWFSNKKSLFVFDNAERNEKFEKFLTGLREINPADKKPFILITSREKDWGPNMVVIPLKELKIEEAMEFVKKQLRISSDDKTQDHQIKELADKMQCFPLTLQQAVAYIIYQRQDGDFGIDSYLEKYEEMTVELLDSKVFQFFDNDYAKTTFTTWKITIDKIRSNENLGELAMQILNLMAYVDPTKIYRENVEHFFDADKEQVKLAVRLLLKYSMISGENEQTVALSIHRLVQEVTKLELREHRKEVETLKELLSYQGNFRENLKHALSIWNYVCKHEELLNAFSALPIRFVFELNNYVEYEKAYSFGLETLKTLGTDIQRMLSLGDALLYQSKYTEALAVFTDAYEKSEDLLRSGDSNIMLKIEHIRAGLNIALVLQKEGKNNEASQRYKAIYEESKEILGPDHSQTLAVRIKIALDLKNNGKYSEALKVLEDEYEKRVENCRVHDLNAAITRENIASLQQSTGEYSEAFKMRMEEYEKNKETLGSDHPETLAAHRRMIYEIQNKKEGYKEFGLFLNDEKLKEKIRLDDPITLKTRDSIASVLESQGKYEEALEIYEDVYIKRKDKLGENHSDTLTSKTKIAFALEKQGKWNEALEVYTKIYKVRKEKLGSGHCDTLSTRHNIAAVKQGQGKYDEALAELEDINKNYTELLGTEHPDTLFVRFNIGAVLKNQGKYDEALEEFKKVHQKIEEKLGSDHPDSLTTRSNIADVLDCQGKFGEALKVHEEIYERRYERLGSDHPSTKAARNNVVTIKQRQGISDEKIKVFTDVGQSWITCSLGHRPSPIPYQSFPEIRTYEEWYGLLTDRQTSH